MQNSIATGSVLGLAICSLTGCASIISGRNADVAIDSFPSNAHVVIHDNNGRQVASLNTPGVVSLKRNRRYFLPARYTAVIEAPGFAPAEVPIRSTVNPWIVGNIAIARYNLAFEYEQDGKPGVSKPGVLQIWTKDGGTWKLLARQAFRPPS